MTFIKCANGDRVSQCYHNPRCQNIPGHGFGQQVPDAPRPLQEWGCTGSTRLARAITEHAGISQPDAEAIAAECADTGAADFTTETRLSRPLRTRHIVYRDWHARRDGTTYRLTLRRERSAQ